MTDLRGATITEFLETVETMRTVYPFENDKAHIVSTFDYQSNSHSNLELYVKDEKTGVHVTMQKEVEIHHDREV